MMFPRRTVHSIHAKRLASAGKDYTTRMKPPVAKETIITSSLMIVSDIRVLP